MFPTRRGPARFKNRLIVLNLLTAGLALTIATAALVLHEYFALRDSLADNLGALAQVVADNSAASLAFRDAEAATETLSTLKAMPHVLRAAIYRRNGNLFAIYRADGGETAFEPPLAPPAPGVGFTHDRVDVFRAVTLAGQPLGMVFIRADLRELYARLAWYGAASAVVVVCALGAALLLLSRMRRRLAGAQEELQLMNDTLEHRVAERTEELEAANRELESFSYSVSHDLRAPLRAINGFSHLLLEAEGVRLSPEGRGMLERVLRSSNRMGQLIEDILEYSRAGRSPLEHVPVDLDALARAVVKEALEDYPGARAEVGPLPVVEGDRTMLRQVMENLVGNAFKYSCKRERPQVEVGAHKRDGATVFYVKDNGAGFDMRYAGRLFVMFQRMHTEGQFPGTGVGLAIVKRLVERHGGHIWAEAEPDKGATFFFTLGGGR